MADTKTAEAWALFDRIIADVEADAGDPSPWLGNNYNPDIGTLERLLGVPLSLNAPPTTGVPALALDVWVAFELRRAGFEPNAVWPRSTAPRVIPLPISLLFKAFEGHNRTAAAEVAAVRARLDGTNPPAGIISASANILGKNYMKQVDVIMSAWDTGPEILISTKRMDSSFGKNAANRVEESYGDAKNLRGRHPLAALGFVYGLSTDILVKEPDKARWLIDLLEKLGKEDDAYDAVCLLLLDYDPALAPAGFNADDDGKDALEGAQVIAADDNLYAITAKIPPDELATKLAALPSVRIAENADVPPALHPDVFMKTIIEHVLTIAPVTLHTEARKRRGWPYVEPKVRKKRGDL